MHHQPMADPVRDDAHWDATILDLLLDEHPGLWSIHELQQLGGDALAVADSLQRLQALGLIHRVNDCVFATRAAAHMHSLAS
jgi:hypothetical protein